MRARSARGYRALVAAAVMLATPAVAAPTPFVLAPGPAHVGFRAYGLGLLPIDGAFTRFQGTLTLDAADPAVCKIALLAEAASLRMPQQDMTDDALGPDLLDVERFTDFRFDGTCAGGRVVGTLLLHGVSRPLTMEVSVKGGRWLASGLMRRADWGMGARPLLAGPEVRITITAGLPADFGVARDPAAR